MSKRVWMKHVAMGVCMAMTTCAAYATDATVAGDAYVNSAHATINYGGLSNLYVGNGGTALIQFDLSSLPAGTTAAQIGKATLKLYVNRINTSGLVSVQPVNSSWSESSVTYATIPSLGTAVASFTPATARAVHRDRHHLAGAELGDYAFAVTSACADVHRAILCSIPKRTTRPATWASGHYRGLARTARTARKPGHTRACRPHGRNRCKWGNRRNWSHRTARSCGSNRRYRCDRPSGSSGQLQKYLDRQHGLFDRRCSF